MYAIVEIAGQQYKVEKDKNIFVHRIEAQEGEKLSFDKVLLLENDGKINVGTPTIQNAQIEAEILKHVKGDKVLVFKKKKRKGYQKMNGHRQYFTQIHIDEIVEDITTYTKKTTNAKVAPKKEEPVLEEKVEMQTTEKKTPKASKEEKTEKKVPAKKATKTTTKQKDK